MIKSFPTPAAYAAAGAPVDESRVAQIQSTGEIKEYPFKSEYEVGVSSLSVSPTKMNVLYIGVPNPIDITASGVPQISP